MQLTLVHKSILAAGLLAAAAAVVIFNSLPHSVKADATPDSGRQPLATSRQPRPSLSPIGNPFPGESNTDSPAFLPSFEALASSNPKKALASLATIDEPDLHSLALAAVATGWAQVDPQAAATWVAGLPSESERSDACGGLISVWAVSAPVDCLAWVVEQLPACRDESLVRLADSWGSSDPQTALTRFFMLEPSDGSERGLRSILSRWAVDDPAAAVGHVSALDKSSGRDDLLKAALSSLAGQDPDLAWKYSDLVSDPKSMEQVRGMALKAMAETRPLEAIELARDAGNGEALLAGIARGWAITDEDAAEKWVSSLPDPNVVIRLENVPAE